MLHRPRILIVEDETLIAMSLAEEVERFDGVVVGPASTVAHALTIVAEADLAGAILDANLADRDVTPVAIILRDRRIPFVLHTGKGVPAELSWLMPELTFIPKPAAPSAVVQCLLGTLQ